MPHNLFGFGQNDRKLLCFVNPILLNQVIFSQRKNIFSILLSIQQKLHRNILGKPSSKGNALETALIDILLNGRTTFQIMLSEKTSETIKIRNIYSKIGGFIPIPFKNQKGYRKFEFLKSFIKNFEYLLKEQNDENESRPDLILLPVKIQWYSSFVQILKAANPIIKYQQLFSCNNKLVDFVICSMKNYSEYGRLEIHIFDPTISQDDKIETKIQRFFEELANFQDKYDQFYINGKYFEVKLNYIGLTTKSDLNGFNCKRILTEKIQEISKATPIQDYATKLKNMKEFELEDCGNLCKVKMNQKYKSGYRVVNTISVVNITKHTKLKCENQNEVQTELRLLQKILKDEKENSRLVQYNWQTILD